MKNTLPILICAVLAAGCGLVGFLLTGYIKWPENTVATEICQTIEFETHKGNEADTSFVDDEYFSIISTYKCKMENKPGDKIPWADVLLCEVHYNPVSPADTIVMLNVNRGEEYSVPDDSGAYMRTTEFIEKYEKCYIKIPKNKLPALKRYKFTYANISWYPECAN